jgi:CII-binding regulator of phage lambda lysogenization HflD
LIFEEQKPKTRKDLKREREVLNMSEEEKLKYIEEYDNTIKGLEKELENTRETAKDELKDNIQMITREIEMFESNKNKILK